LSNQIKRRHSALPTPVQTGQPAITATPRSNVTLTQKLAAFDSLAEGLDYAARGVTGFNFYSGRGQLLEAMTYRTLRERAVATARRLAGLNLKRGDRVGLVAETGPEFMEVFFGCQYAGLVPCPMPYSMHIGGMDAYVERIAGMLRAAGARAAIAPSELVAQVRDAGEMASLDVVLSYEELRAAPASISELVPFGAHDAAYIQYSSGSTSEPKGVLVTQRAIIANTRGILRDGLKIEPNDRAFSWLPLYHDMGLVGFCLAPLMGQVTVDYIATTAFARRPALWLKLMSDNRSTIAYSPSFGYELAARRINGEAPTLDLSSWRVAGIGGDMVRADILDLFAEKLSVAGFKPRAFLPSYGMAESTLAITFADVDQPVRIDSVDPVQYKLSRRAVPVNGTGLERRFVVCGRLLPGHEAVIRDENSKPLGEREIGRIFVKGPSVMAGYFNNAEATRAVLGNDAFMDTGDMGYWLGDELVITGRAKDLILHNGRNIWPQDIEWAAERIEPLRSGDVAAIAVEDENGEDAVVVLVQCRLSDRPAIEGLRRQVASAVHSSAGVECDVVMVPPRSLPFTSSGKLSRAGAKASYLAGEIAEIVSDGSRTTAASEKELLETVS